MPFVFDRSAQSERSAKRRKLSHILDMARSNLEEESEPKWLENAEASGQSTRESSSHEVESRKEEIRTSSREELIECIKRGQKPTWVPKPNLQALCEEEDALQEKRNAIYNEAGSSSSQLDDASKQPQQGLRSQRAIGSRWHDPIERPPSALHSGDFSENRTGSTQSHVSDTARNVDPFTSTSTDSSSPPSWLSHVVSPPAFGRMPTEIGSNSSTLQKLQTRRRAPSLGSGLSSAFIMRVPTSPLVHATTHDYLDLEDGEFKKPSTNSVDYGNRRRTMPPHSFHSFSMSLAEHTPPNFSRPLPHSLRRESSMPEHSHKPRRSLSSFTYQPRSNPTSPLPRSRRPSLGSEIGVRRRSSMVGSFEESILRGRMSTPPSKPLDFVAQIGVMGKGECPSNLKCPAHVTVPFPAVYYSYESTAVSRSLIDDAPSPYVGTIDLEHSLKSITLRTKAGSSNQRAITESAHKESSGQNGPGRSKANTEEATIGGAYRVPKQGQLQIILKNPNKTAVKLFLVPYDLNGMEAGTKTFVRQRSFSSGPIIEKPLSDKTTQSSIPDPMDEKLILRYLVHVKFCCPAKDRYYLYNNIRVVFANRVPDGKEKLRNEIQLPDPKFSSFRPAVANPKGSRNIEDKGLDSSHYSSSPLSARTLRNMDQLDGIDTSQFHVETRQQTEKTIQFPRSHIRSPTYESYPFSTLARNGHLKDFLTIEKVDQAQAISPVTGFKVSDRTRVSPIPWNPSSGSSMNRSYSPAPAEPGDGLLSRKFRELSEHGTVLSKLATYDSNGDVNDMPKHYRQEDMSRDGDIGLAHTFYIRSDQTKEAF